MALCSNCKKNETINRFKRCSNCNQKAQQKEKRNFCEHNQRKRDCVQCHGSSICEHKRRKRSCKQCKGITSNSKSSTPKPSKKSPLVRFINNAKSRIRSMVKRLSDRKPSLEYLGCSKEHFKQYIEKQFTGEMTWANYGSLWHIDHIIPLKYNKPNIDEIIARLHYTNTQPMLAIDNIRKSNRYIG